MPKGVTVRVRARAWWSVVVGGPVSVTRQRSSVVEHSIRNRAVVGSIPTAGSEARRGLGTAAIGGPAGRQLPMLGVVGSRLTGSFCDLWKIHSPCGARI